VRRELSGASFEAAGVAWAVTVLPLAPVRPREGMAGGCAAHVLVRVVLGRAHTAIAVLDLPTDLLALAVAGGAAMVARRPAVDPR
jgi:hypothetical protein